jgi:alpha/beta superfamily hydrolase
MRETKIDFYTSKKLSLEGIFTLPDGLSTPPPGVVVCHPHPALGGDMENPVVTAICDAAGGEGIGSLRFNFRGVGESEGEFTNGDKEPDDLRAALHILRLLIGRDAGPLAIAGYSFGAAALLDGLRRCKSARALVMIAPPLSALKRSGIAGDGRPKLFVVGQRDRVAPSVDLQATLDGYSPPFEFEEIPEAGHDLSGHEDAVAERVAGFLVASLGADSPSGPGRRRWNIGGLWPWR